MSPRSALLAADVDVVAWRGVAALSVAETASWGVLYYAFGVLLRPLQEHLQTSEAVVAGAFSLALLVAGLASTPAGRLIDRWGARRVMTIASVVATAAFTLVARVDSVATLYLVWALIGASHAGVLYEPAFAAITGWFPEVRERSRALLAVTTLGGFASTIFLPTTAALCNSLGWQGAVLALGALLGAVVIPLHATLPARDHGAGARLETSGHAEARSSPAERRAVFLLATAFSLHAFASTGAAVHLVSHLSEGGLDLPSAAKLAGLAGASQVPGRWLFQPLCRVLGPNARLPVLLGAQALALVGFGLTSGFTLGASIILFGAANGLVTLERATLVAEWFGRDRYATFSGRIATFTLSARAAAPLAVGLGRQLGAHATPFLVLALLVGIASATLPLGRR